MTALPMDSSYFKYRNRLIRPQSVARPMRQSPYGGGIFGSPVGYGGLGDRVPRRPPPFFGGGQFGGRRPFPGMYRGMPTFMNRMGGGGRFGGMQRPPFGGMQRPPFISGGEYKKKMPHFGGGFRPPFGGNEGGFGGTDYSAQISELEKKIKELQSQLSGQPAASPAMPEPLPAMPKPPTSSYNPVPQVDVNAFNQFRQGFGQGGSDRPTLQPGGTSYEDMRFTNIPRVQPAFHRLGQEPPTEMFHDRLTGKQVTQEQVDSFGGMETRLTPSQRSSVLERDRAGFHNMRNLQDKAAGISVPDFNTPPGTPIAIPPSVGGQYEEPAREFLKGTPAPLDPNYALQPGDPGYVTSGPARPNFILPSNIQFNRGGIGSIGGMMGGAGGRATPPSHLQATPHTPTGHIARLSPEVIAQAKARRNMSRR